MLTTGRDSIPFGILWLSYISFSLDETNEKIFLASEVKLDKQSVLVEGSTLVKLQNRLRTAKNPYHEQCIYSQPLDSYCLESCQPLGESASEADTAGQWDVQWS